MRFFFHVTQATDICVPPPSCFFNGDNYCNNKFRLVLSFHRVPKNRRSSVLRLCLPDGKFAERKNNLRIYVGTEKKGDREEKESRREETIKKNKPHFFLASPKDDSLHESKRN